MGKSSLNNNRNWLSIRYCCGLPYGKTSIQVVPFTVKAGTQFAYGGVAGGEGSQLFLPLDGNAGGLSEYIIDPKNVKIIDFKVLKP